jgi:gamma-glutamylcyclotransferase (GGCT)/AIG2-like uncharacterized protein YtfP
MTTAIWSPDLRVFVYGTLKPGEPYWQRYCEGKVWAALPAMVKGRLFHLPEGYPALLTGGEKWVQGYLLYLKDESTLAAIDELEGFHPEKEVSACEYQRVKIPCFDPTGDPFEVAWTYVMDEKEIARLGGVPVPRNTWTSGVAHP